MQKNDDIARGMALHILTSMLVTRGHSILRIVGKQCSTLQSNLNSDIVTMMIAYGVGSNGYVARLMLNTSKVSN